MITNSGSKKLIDRIKSRCISILFGSISYFFRIIRLEYRLDIIWFDRLWFSSKKSKFVLSDPAFKQLLDQLQPRFPVAETATANLPPISIVIPAHPKDFALLQSVIDGVLLNSLNPIREILIITPSIKRPVVAVDHPLIFLQDDEVLSARLKSYLGNQESQPSLGWIKQQVVKIEAVLSQVSTDYALVLDADTVILAPRVFVSMDTQELNFANEYHEPYFSHVSRFDGGIRATGLSFVTHYQLWDRRIVREIWAEHKLIDWLDARDRTQVSCISEYQTYGQFLLHYYPSRFMLTRWGNVNYSRKSQDTIGEASYLALKAKFPGSLSVSVHSYS